MRVGFPGGPRLEWYDRNPQAQQFSYQAFDVAPHAPVQRWTYTVPAGKKFFLENSVTWLQRQTAATAAGRASINIDARNVFVLQSVLITNTVGDKDTMNAGRSVIMRAGEVLSSYTADLSTAGTINYMSTAHGIEFDA